MALDPRDRRELAKAGLVILAFGFVISPTLHAVLGHGGVGLDPDETQPHSHDGQRSDGRAHSHPDDSLEHLGACCAPAIWLPMTPQLVWAIEELTPEREQVPQDRRVRSPAMPQGP